MNTRTHNLLFQFPKFAFLGLNSAIVTIALFLAMYFLIRTDEVAPLQEPVVVDDNFLMPERVIDVYEDIELPDSPTDPVEEPELAKVEEVTDKVAWTDRGIFTSIENSDGMNINPDFIPPQPVYRIQPQYPQNALRRGIEGFVVLEFDVDEAGRPLNIVVSYAEPERVFNNSAMKAVEKWRYDPIGESGQPEYKKNVLARLTFKITDNKK